MNFLRNNLDNALSPYILQHKNNPIYWQEWSKDVLAYAQQQNKLVLVSIGYATCHWCHVMSYDTFNDQETSQFLNEQFVSISIDREIRPDIDLYMLSFALEFAGSGGWPLNVILTPDLKPFAAVTYMPAKSENPQLPPFLTILRKALLYYNEHRDDIKPYILQPLKIKSVQPETILTTIESQFDATYGGFGAVPKFPPHSTLLFLLSIFAQENVKSIYIMLKKTLDAMSLGGLHDHLQGGFFRYCMDQQWTFPHFEKMLYDQAWLLWSYSAGYKALKEDSYKKIIEKIIICLQTSFNNNGLYYAALDADTEGKEGATYLWTTEELKSLLTPQEFAEFSHVYSIHDVGPLQGFNHLIKSREVFLDTIENKLLKARNLRPQPAVDKLHLTSWNALTGIGLLMAYRHTQHEQALTLAQNLFTILCTKHIQNEILYHCSIDENLVQEGLLEDYATMLLFATYMHEEFGTHGAIMNMLETKLQTFYKDNAWFESLGTDFMPIPANPYDYALPTSSSIAELARTRAHILSFKSSSPLEFKEPLRCDFLNIAVLMANGGFHIIEAPEKVAWHNLPLNVIQRKGTTIKDYFGDSCKEYPSIDALINGLQSE